MKNIIEVTEANFEKEVLQADLPVVVDFFATWCGPCQMMAPVLEAFAAEYDGKIKFGKLDVDNDQGLAGQFNITGVPTLMVFKGGEVVDTIVGFMQPAALKTRLEKVTGLPVA